MPAFGQTPEGLLGRNDSKNPATTCKGLTSSGRPCRRALASPKSSPIGKRSPDLGGVVALVQADGEIHEALFYCWQHKDQAEQKLKEEQKQRTGEGGMKKRSTDLFPLQERSSIDTLVQKLGIDADTRVGKSFPSRSTERTKPPKRTEVHDFATESRRDRPPYAEKYAFAPSHKQKPKVRKPGFWASLCCVANHEDGYVEIVRHRQRVSQTRPDAIKSTSAAGSRSRPTRTGGIAGPQAASGSDQLPIQNLPIRPSPQSRRDSSRSQTGQLLSLIPQHLSPQTTSILLAELSKPISAYDEEGYIYIFWLTPQAKAAPTEETARSLLRPATHSPRDRRPSDVMTEYSFDGSESGNRGKKTVMLKIGRANNVTRRMNEWQRQCGYALNLVRWYPYVTPSVQTSLARHGESLYSDLSRPSSKRRVSDAIRKVPCVKRVERLIHLELAEKQVKKQCVACGKEHREWFEAEANQAGIKEIDECIRRWVGWAEMQAGMV